MRPGDLVGIGRGSSARLYRTPAMQDNPPDICGVAFLGEVGVVCGMLVKEDKHRVYLLLFGEKLGWRDPMPFEVIRVAP